MHTATHPYFKHASLHYLVYLVDYTYLPIYLFACFALCMKVAFCHRGYMIFVFWGQAYITGHNILLKRCLAATAISSKDACTCLQELEDLGTISPFEIGCSQFTMTEQKWHSPGRSRERAHCTPVLQGCDIWFHSSESLGQTVVLREAPAYM